MARAWHVQARRRLLGGGHEETLGSQTELALLLKREGDLEGAGALMREVLDARRAGAAAARPAGEGGEGGGGAAAPAPPGPDPELLRSLSNLGQVLKEQGDTAGARALFGEAVEGAVATLGPEHAKTKNYRRWLERVQDE